MSTLKALIRILEGYKNLSGLECNIEKTAVMQVGDKGPPGAEILGLGLVFVTILGTIIVNDSGNHEDNAGTLVQLVKELRSRSGTGPGST